MRLSTRLALWVGLAFVLCEGFLLATSIVDGSSPWYGMAVTTLVFGAQLGALLATRNLYDG